MGKESRNTISVMSVSDDHKYYIDYIRVWLTLLVVVGHGTFYSIFTKYGGIDYLEIMKRASVYDTFFHRIIDHVHGWIYSFHMPAYFCLSGAVFSLELAKNKYGNLHDIITFKINRLLLPFAFVWCFWNVPIKIISGYYENSDSIILDVCTQMLFPANVYLWYLEALFLLFIFVYVLQRAIKTTSTQCILVFSLNIIGIVLNHYFRLSIPFGNPLRYVLWFWLGIYIDEISVLVIQKLRKLLRCPDRSVVFYLSLIYLLTYIVCQVFEPYIWYATEIILSLSGIVWLWVASLIAIQGFNDYQKNKLAKIGSMTYGIYLWAEPLNYLVLYLYYNIFGVNVFGSEIGAICIFLTRVIGSTVIASIITLSLRKIYFPIKAY